MPLQLQHAVIAVEDNGFYDHPGIDVAGVFRAAWTDLVSARDRAGRFDPDPAAREERLRRPVLETIRTRGSRRTWSRRGRSGEGAREPARDQGRARVHQGPDPRQVPEHGLLRSRRVRRPGRRADVLPEGRVRAHGASSRRCSPAWSRAPRSTTRSSTSRTARSGATTSSSRWRPRGTSPQSARPSSRRRPIKVDPDRGRPELPRQARVLPRLHATRPDSTLRRGAGVRRRAAGHDDARPRDAALRGGGRREPPARRPATPPRRSSRSTRGTARSARWYGGKNFAISKVNLATGDGGSGRQAGSAFKPFTLAAAMEQGYSLNERWHGPASITIPDPACYTDGAPWELDERGRRGERRLHAAAGRPRTR